MMKRWFNKKRMLNSMVGLVYSLMAWQAINWLIIELSFVQYFLIELTITLIEMACERQMKVLEHEEGSPENTSEAE